MSRMSAIRNLATSGVGAGAIGATVGGAGAYYSGQDIASGAGYGAMMGAGGRVGAPMMARATGAARLGMKSAIGSGMRNLQRPGMAGGVKAMSGAYGMLGSAQRGFSGMGAIRTGVAGGAAGLGYSMMSSNQGLNVTHRNATLNQKLQYQKSLAMQKSAVRINETRMKKSIWQPGAY